MRKKQNLSSPSRVFPFSLQNFIISNSKAFDNEIQMKVHRISFNTISSKNRQNIKRNLKESQWKKALIFPMFFSNPETIFTSNLPFCFINLKSYAPVDFTFHDFIVDNLRN
jgi:pyruvate carboxylase